MLQQQAVPYKAAQFAGAALGVAVGCLIGMTPLAFMEPGFFVSAAEGIDQAAEAAAAAVSAVQEAAGGAAAGASDAAPAAAALQSAAAAGGKVT